MAGRLEIEMGRLAALKGRELAVRTFARWIKTDHELGNEILELVARRAGAEAPAALDPPHQATLDQLNALSGREFDRRYVALEVQSHDTMIPLFQWEAGAALGNADLKDFAARAPPVLVQHGAEAHELQASPGIASSGERGGQGTGGSGSSSPRVGQ